MHRIVVVGLFLAAAGVIAGAQAPAAFEVASVRENTSPSEVSSSSGPSPGRFTIVNTPLRFIVLDAFGLRTDQLIGAPEWTETVRFDVTATYSAGTEPERDWRPMLQQLLRDRFRLVTHRETRELPVYELVLVARDGSLGPRLTRSDVDCEKLTAERRAQAAAGRSAPVAGPRQTPVCTMLTSRQSMIARGRPIQALLGPLQSLTGRPVVDRTRLTGNFDLDMQWTMSGDLGVTAAGDGPSIFTTLQEQLGLKLEPSRASFEVVVIDAVSRPTAD
jgi:uncharacterized protein (TIGR03435 family)